MPMRPTSGAATSLTRAANWSRSLYTSSTVSVPVDVNCGGGKERERVVYKVNLFNGCDIDGKCNWAQLDFQLFFFQLISLIV